MTFQAPSSTSGIIMGTGSTSGGGGLTHAHQPSSSIDRSPTSMAAKLTFQDETQTTSSPIPTATAMKKGAKIETTTSTANKPLLRLDLTSSPTTLPPPEEFSQQSLSITTGVSPRHTCGKNGEKEVRSNMSDRCLVLLYQNDILLGTYVHKLNYDTIYTILAYYTNHKSPLHGNYN